VNNNNFTQLEETVFGPMLEQMAAGTGSVDFEGSMFIISSSIYFFVLPSPVFTSHLLLLCIQIKLTAGSEKICRLGWLNRYEVGVKSLICSNGTSFKNLHSTGFNHCPQINSN